MPSRSGEGKDNGNSLVDDGDLSGTYKPVIVERGKKFAVYDKNGKLIILGYNRKIVEGYAYDRVRKG